MRFQAQTVRPLRALLGGVDGPAEWPDLDREATEHLIRALAAHGALPLVHFSLARHAGFGQELPPALLRAAEAEYMASAAQAALRLREIRVIVDELSDAGIGVLVLKGAALAETAYENVALRPMSDIDLLVNEMDLQPAGKVLEERGYRLKSDEAPDLAHHWVYARPIVEGVMSMVELHRRPFATPPFDRSLAAEGLFDRAESAHIGGCEVRVPFGPDMLLHLAGHLVLQHAREERLIWVADIDRVARQLDDEAWRQALSLAAGVGLARAVMDALTASRIWFGTPVPPWVLAALSEMAESDPSAATAHSRVRARAPIGQEGARRLTDLRGAKGLRAKLRYALAFAFPPTSFMREHHGVDHVSALPIYYARRVARGLVQVVAEIIRRPEHALAADEPPERWMVESDSPSSMD